MFVIYVAGGLGGCEIIIRSWWGGRIFILYMEAVWILYWIVYV